MVFVKQGVFIPFGDRCYCVHLYKDHLSYEMLNRIEGNITEMFCLDSNAIVNLLESFDIVGETRSFDFGEPASLDNDACYNTTGFIKGKVFSHLHRFS